MFQGTLAYSCGFMVAMLRRLRYPEPVNITCPPGDNISDYTQTIVPAGSSLNSNVFRDPYIDMIKTTGRDMYTYSTPVIVVIGVIGNVISLSVFLSKTMRKQPACYYLMALSATDLVVLIVYVSVEWLDRGLPEITGNNDASPIRYDGACHVFLYLSYVSRFLSAWLIVVFTVERYIGVCKPLKRREMCTRSFARRMIFILILVSLLLCIYKPLLSGVSRFGGSKFICGSKNQHRYASFILDAIFAVATTFVPFVVISSLNFIIIRRLFLRNRTQRLSNTASREQVIRIEFTLILLVISSCFIAVTIPYFVTWTCQFLKSKCVTLDHIYSPYWYSDYLSGVRNITKTIYFLNYSMNFFLYSLTGASFRRELKFLFNPKLRRRFTLQSSGISRTHSTTCHSRI